MTVGLGPPRERRDRGVPLRWCSSLGPGANLGALHATAWEKDPETCHVELRTADDEGATHRAGVELASPVALSCVRLRFAPGAAPRAFRLLGRPRAGDALEPLGEFAAAGGEQVELDLGGRSLLGVALEQAPGGGAARSPGLLLLRALALVPAASHVLDTALVALDGRVVEPASPFPYPALPGRVLELGPSRGLRVRLREPRRLASLGLDLARVASAGRPEHVAAVLAGATLRATLEDGSLVELAPPIVLDAARAGTVAGRVRAVVALDAVRGPLRALELVWRRRPRLLGLIDVVLDAPVPPGAAPLPAPPAEDEDEERARARAAVRDAPGDVLGARLRARGAISLEHAASLVDAPRHAGVLAVPGLAPTIGLAPDGTLELPWPAPAPLDGASGGACLHVALAVAGAAPVEPARRQLRDGRAEVTFRYPTLHLVMEAAIDPTAPPSLLVEARVEPLAGAPATTTVGFGLALRDLLLPLPLSPSALELETPAGFTLVEPAEPDGELVLRGPLAPGETTRLRLPLQPGAGAASDPAPTVAAAATRVRAREDGCLAEGLDYHLPGPGWDALSRRLTRCLSGFVRPDGSMPYGVFPSCYAGDVFGLEEDWAFHALALWGHLGLARRAFRATYLTDAHLSKRHYLHDLRNGLTPWQAARLARLSGDATWLDEADRARLRACAAWTRAARARREEGALPGLLPPYRYGGDLDFPTQSLSADTANWAGLRALAELLPEDAAGLTAEADDYRRAILAAFEAVRTVDAATGLAHYPLHTGGGDPGDYYQLLVAGIVGTYGFFAPDDPILQAMHAYLERTGRLCLALPRFDGWATDGLGIDAHYALGYLLDVLRRGDEASVARFHTGLVGLVAAAMDPDVATFREVGPLLLPGARPPLDAHLPGRYLGLAEPCLGGPAVVLVLLRHALLTELGDGGVRLLPAPLPSWWRTDGAFHLERAPTEHGRVSLRVEQALGTRGELVVEVEARDVAGLELVAPSPPGWRLLSRPPARLEAGAHRVVLAYAADPG